MNKTVLSVTVVLTKLANGQDCQHQKILKLFCPVSKCSETTENNLGSLHTTDNLTWTRQNKTVLSGPCRLCELHIRNMTECTGKETQQISATTTAINHLSPQLICVKQSLLPGISHYQHDYAVYQLTIWHHHNSFLTGYLQCINLPLHTPFLLHCYTRCMLFALMLYLDLTQARVSVVRHFRIKQSYIIHTVVLVL